MADLVTSSRCAYVSTLGDLSTSNGAYLSALITAASKAVQRYCKRSFTQATYTEYHDGGNYPYDLLILREFPVTAVYRVATEPECVLKIENTADANQRATVATTTTGLSLVRVASGTETTSTLAYADYATVTLLANAVTALGNGWTATAETDWGDWPSADLKPLQGAYNAKGAAAELWMYTEEVPPQSWHLDANAGVLTGRFPRGTQTTFVKYQAGWSTIPEDVQEACVQHVLSLYQAGLADSNLASESLGPYSKTYVQQATKQALSANVRGLLAPYVAHDRTFTPDAGWL